LEKSWAEFKIINMFFKETLKIQAGVRSRYATFSTCLYREFSLVLDIPSVHMCRALLVSFWLRSTTLGGKHWTFLKIAAHVDLWVSVGSFRVDLLSDVSPCALQSEPTCRGTWSRTACLKRSRMLWIWPKTLLRSQWAPVISRHASTHAFVLRTGSIIFISHRKHLRTALHIWLSSVDLITGTDRGDAEACRLIGGWHASRSLYRKWNNHSRCWSLHSFTHFLQLASDMTDMYQKASYAKSYIPYFNSSPHYLIQYDILFHVQDINFCIHCKPNK